MKLVYGAGSKNNEVNVFHVDRKDLPIRSELEAQKKANLLLNEIETKKINGKTIVEMMKCSDFSLWWFVKPTIFQAIKESIDFIESFNKVIIDKQPKTVLVKNDLSKLSLIEKICKKNHIKLEYSNFEKTIFNIKTALIPFFQSYRYYRIMQNKTKTRIKLFKNKHISIPDVANKILFAVPTSYRRKIFDAEKGIVNGEFIVGPLIKEMKNNIIGIDLDYTFRGQPEVLLERLDDVNMPWIPIEILFDDKKLSRKSQRQFLKQYSDIISSRDFQVLFQFNGIDLWSTVYYEFKKLMFSPYLEFYLKLMDSFDYFLHSTKPKAIFLPYEAGPLALSIIVSCKREGIKTVGMQHGIIYGENPDYSHHNFRTEENQLGMPIPDHMLVFGNSSKKFLMGNKSYPPEKLIEFGHPMYLEIDQIKKHMNSSDIKTKFKIPDNKKIILFTTGRYQSNYQGYENQNYDELILEKLLETYSNDSQYHVVLKPHPLDKDLRLYQKLISNYASGNFVILQENLFELLQICDVVVCYFSTVLLDSIAYGRPAVEVFFDNSDYEVYLGKDSPILSVQLNSLPTIMSRLLFDSKFQNDVNEKIISFLKDQFNMPNNDYRRILSTLIT